MVTSNQARIVPVSDRDPATTSESPQPSKSLSDVLKPEKPARVWKYIVLHHSGGELDTIESIDRNHRQRTDRSGKPWLGIGYHLVIGNGRETIDGEIKPTFRWRDQLHGAHAGHPDYNDHGIGICLIGNLEDRPPTARQLEATRRLVQTLCREYTIPRENVIPHRSVRPTQCPGQQFPLKEILAAVTESHPSETPKP
jgi:hypothetical protein